MSAESIRHSSLSFDIPFDRQQLADYLCIDRAAMSTEISKLQKEGFIKTNRNHFELTVFFRCGFKNENVIYIMENIELI